MRLTVAVLNEAPKDLSCYLSVMEAVPPASLRQQQSINYDWI